MGQFFADFILCGCGKVIIFRVDYYYYYFFCYLHKICLGMASQLRVLRSRVFTNNISKRIFITTDFRCSLKFSISVFIFLGRGGLFRDVRPRPIICGNSVRAPPESTAVIADYRGCRAPYFCRIDAGVKFSPPQEISAR